ncbi:MAG: hypothetical protein J1E62_06310 [Lachnospiraceae bacterium]|nr:hypothetical protein [Lachnospiraceae bacterium]
MFGSKQRKARKALDEAWRKMEMSCENNYKDMAQDDLRDFEALLEQYQSEGLLSPEEYESRSYRLADKKIELKNYDHKQHIGW